MLSINSLSSLSESILERIAQSTLEFDRKSERSPIEQSSDMRIMKRALELAKKGQFSVTPNPQVGCVILDSCGEVLAEGYHKKAGEGHAEVNALDIAKRAKKDDLHTAFVTLEPCSHFGRTAPCADALIAANLSVVVVACLDPNPNVAGQGIKKLTDAGIHVRLGLLESEALKVNEYFFHRVNYSRPFVTLKLASSLDGKIALANGESKWITGSLARADVQKGRATSCAILSTASTVIADNPSLNVRPVELESDLAKEFEYRGKPLKRFIIDSKNRLNTLSYKIFQDAENTFILNAEVNSMLTQNKSKVESTTYTPHQVQIESNEVNGQTSLNLINMLEQIATFEINHLWVEAGSSLASALIDADLVNRLILYQAPKILGANALQMLNTSQLQKLDDCKQGIITSVEKIGSDTKTTIDFNINSVK